MMNCKCRNCGKIYDDKKARGDWKGFCSARCTHKKARELGWRNRKDGPSEYAVLSRAGEIGNVFVDLPL